MIRFGKAADMPEIMDIWRESFGDAQEEIAEFFRCLAGEVRLLVWEEAGRVLGQLCLLPVRLWSHQKAAKAEYIYAAATKGEARGRGICTALLGAAASLLKEEGSCGVLVPADGKLAMFYAERGFCLCFGEEIWEIEAFGKKNTDGGGKVSERSGRRKSVLKPVSVSAYIKYRSGAFAEVAGIEPSGAMQRYAVSSFVREGGICAELTYGEQVCGVLCRPEHAEKEAQGEVTLRIQEITVRDGAEALRAVQALLSHFDCRHAVLRRSYKTCGIYLPEGMEENGSFNLVLD